MPEYISSVTGNVPWKTMGITDAHNHVWIDPVEQSIPGSPVLNDLDSISTELSAYRLAGGGAIIDCQPGGCGRDGNKLILLSTISGVSIISCTGFHRPIYYSPDHWLWQSSADKISEYFIQEIETGEQETLGSENPVKAGFIKIAGEETLAKTCQPALLAAAQAARLTGKSIEIHTEKGQAASEILAFFVEQGVDARQIILCHMDKRPDVGLHRELIQSGAALEYDTIFRTKYQPEKLLWPLINQLVKDGCENNICLATDMAESMYWSSLGLGPGLQAFPSLVKQRLLDMGLPTEIVKKLIGGNICRILANE
jgi:5-phospho-D-xylono-1,4-lactonase